MSSIQLWQQLLQTCQYTDDLSIIGQILANYMSSSLTTFKDVEIRLRATNSRLHLIGMSTSWFGNQFNFMLHGVEKSYGLWMSTKPFESVAIDMASDDMFTIEENLQRLEKTGFCTML